MNKVRSNTVALRNRAQTGEGRPCARVGVLGQRVVGGGHGGEVFTSHRRRSVASVGGGLRGRRGAGVSLPGVLSPVVALCGRTQQRRQEKRIFSDFTYSERDREGGGAVCVPAG